MTTGRTSNNYVYPNGDDPIRNGDNVMRQLAEQLPPRLIIQGSPLTGASITTNTDGLARITFPTPFATGLSTAPAFTIYPIAVSLNYYVRVADGTSLSPSVPGGVSRTAAIVKVYTASNMTPVSNGTISVIWQAIGVITPE